MTHNEIVSAILSQFPGATMVRKDTKAPTNFIAIPMGENEDGVMEYASVKVGSLLSKDTERNAAFDFEAAKASYEAYSASVAEKASKPKATPKSKADPEKHAASIARAEAALAWLIENPGQHAAMEIKTALPEIYEEQTIMQVGSDLKALYKEKADCGLVLESKGGKNYWSFNA
jgi:hypothetical protein